MTDPTDPTDPTEPKKPPATDQALEEEKQKTDYYSKQLIFLERQLAVRKKIKDDDAGTLKRQIEILEIEQDINEVKSKIGILNEEQTIEAEKKYKQAKKILELESDLSSELSNQAKTMLGINGNASSLFGKMVQISGESGNISAAFADAAKEIAKSLTFSRLLASAVDGIVGQTKKLFTDMDQAFSQFEKTAGGVDAFKGRIVELRDSNVEYALSIQEASAAFSDLKVGFAGFAGVSIDTQNALANTTAQMAKLGVSSSETIKIQSMLVKGFQMTGQQAGDMQNQLMATAKSMNLPMQQVVKDFANASSNMKAHGANMQKVFLDLQNQSKNTGIEFSKLQSITGKFDTFEGAADAAGNLNAILGGDYLNSIQLLNADEGERVRLMQDALKMSGKSFEAMSKQERMATANALGLEDATELQKLMNNETEAGTVEILNKAQAEKEMAQSIKDVTTMQDKLTAIMAQFAVILTPVLDGIKSFLTLIGKLMSDNPIIAKSIMIVVGALTGLYIIGNVVKGFADFKDTLVTGYNAIKDFIKGIIQKLPFMKTEQKAIEGIADAQKQLNEEGKNSKGAEKMGDTIKSIGEAAKNSWKEILAFGAAILMIGAGIALAALGLAELVKAFQGLTGPEILGALGALLIVLGAFIVIIALLGIIMLAGPGAAAVAGMLALGAAFLMIGAGIAIAALGLSQLVKSFAGLGDAAMPAAIAVAALSVSMYLITSALAAAIPVTAIAGAAFAAAAPGMLAFGASIALIGLGVAVAAVGIGFLAKSIGDMFEKINKSNPETISGAFAAIFDSLSLTNIAKFAAFADQADELTNSLNKLALSLSVVGVGLKTVSGFNALFSPGSVASPSVTATPGTATNAAAATNNTSSSNIVPVAIYIDSKKVGEILDPRYKKMIDDKLNNIGSRTVPI